MTDVERLFGPATRIGGALCLDFVNTADWRTSDHPSDRLNTYDDLLLWALHGNLLGEDQIARLRELAREQPREAARVLKRARAVREALFRIFTATERRAEPAPSDLATFNQELAAAMAHATLARDSNRYTWSWEREEESLGAVLWQVTRSAADLLTSPAHLRVRRCANEPCGWLFLDESKNGSRRWCSMALCGGRAKMRDYYRRKQGRAGAGIADDV